MDLHEREGAATAHAANTKEEGAMKTGSIIVTLLLVMMTAVPRAQNAPRPDADPRIEKIVASVSQERLKELLTRLVSFGTRNTLSDQESTTRGIGAARNW